MRWDSKYVWKKYPNAICLQIHTTRLTISPCDNKFHPLILWFIFLGGYYCPSSGMTVVTDECWGGFYCPSGIDVPNPVDYICPAGMHCPNGSALYLECPGGSFTNYSGAADCDVCPESYYCTPVQPENATDAYKLCPRGYYCPQGKVTVWYCYKRQDYCRYINMPVQLDSWFI